MVILKEIDVLDLNIIHDEVYPSTANITIKINNFENRVKINGFISDKLNFTFMKTTFSFTGYEEPELITIGKGLNDKEVLKFLPKTLKFDVIDGRTIDVPMTWESLDYTKDELGTFNFKGTYELPDDFEENEVFEPIQEVQVIEGNYDVYLRKEIEEILESDYSQITFDELAPHSISIAQKTKASAEDVLKSEVDDLDTLLSMREKLLSDAKDFVTVDAWHSEFEFKEHKNHVEITNYIGNNKKVYLPEEYKGKKVTELAHSSFRKKGIEEIVFTENIERLGKYAFSDNELTEATMFNNVDYGEYVFYDNNIEKVTIEEGITEIPGYMFSKNLIEEVILPESLQGISWYAFKENKIKTLSLPENLRSIRQSAFEENKIEEINVPNSLEYIGSSVFRHNLLTEVDIPPSVKEIANQAFSYNKLQRGTVRIFNFRKNIDLYYDYHPFTYNPGKQERIAIFLDEMKDAVYIEDVKYTHPNEYEGIYIPKGSTDEQVETILKDMKLELKLNTKELVEVDPKWDFKNIDKGKIGADYDVPSNLVGPKVPVENLDFISYEPHKEAELSFKYAKNDNKVSLVSVSNLPLAVDADGVLTLPDQDDEKNDVTEIGRGTFQNMSEKYLMPRVKEVKLPNKLEVINARSFQNNTIEKLSFPETLKRIEMDAFTSNNLKSLIIPSSVVQIGDYAFSENKLIEDSVYIQNSADNIVLASTTFESNLAEVVPIYLLDINRENLKAKIDSFRELNKSDYTRESYREAELIVEESIMVLNEEFVSQKTIDQASEAVTQAKENLVNLLSLKEEMTKAEKIELSGFTESSVEAFETVFESAQVVVANDKASQSEVDAALEALLDAINNLEEIPVDKGLLEAKVAEAVEIDTSTKTDQSVEVFNQALEMAEEMLSNESASQSEVDAALEALLEAIGNLEEIPVDMGLLEDKVAEALAIDTSTKTDQSVEIFNQALEMAKEMLSNESASQSEVDAALEALTESITNLEEKEVDKSSLSETIRKARAVSVEGKTEESIKALQDVIADAEKVKEDPKASEDDVVAAINALESAIVNLQDIPKEVADKTALAKQIEQAEKLVADNYTEESFTHLKNVLGQAKVVFNSEDVSQAEVDELLEALKKAESKLVVKDEGEEDDETEEKPTDLTELKAVIEQAKELDLTNKTEASKEALETALAQGYQVMQKENPTETEVATALKAILDAIESLEEEKITPHLAYIEEFAPITVEFGTKESELNLPKSLTLHLSDKTKRDANVDWVLKGSASFDGEKAGKYHFVGNYELAEDISGEKLPIEITVIVKEKEKEIPVEKPEEEKPTEKPGKPEEKPEDDKKDLEELTDPLDKKAKDDPVESELKKSTDELPSTNQEHEQNNQVIETKDDSYKEQAKEKKILPKTATNLFNILIVGFGILSIGLFYFFKKRGSLL